MGITALQTRRRVQGPSAWFIGYLLYTAGLFMLFLRDIAPDFITYMVATLVMFIGATAVPVGISAFLGLPPGKHLFAVFLASGMGLYGWFLYGRPDTTSRVMVYSVFMGCIYLYASLYLWRRAPESLKKPGRIAAIFFALAFLVHLLRIFAYGYFSAGMGIFSPGSSDWLYYIATLILLPGLTFAQLQLVNGKLLADIEAASNERILLVREMNHRVKNNLAMVNSFVSLQSAGINDPAFLAAMEGIKTRIHSISLVHDRLYHVDTGEMLHIAEYLSKLIEDLGKNARNFVIRSELDPLEMDSRRAVSLGIIVSELVTNAIKYASVEPEGGTIDISLRKQNARIRLCIADSGRGFAEGSGKGLGTLLVDALVKQLHGTISRRNEGGAVAEVEIPA